MAQQGFDIAQGYVVTDEGIADPPHEYEGYRALDVLLVLRHAIHDPARIPTAFQ